MDYVVIAATALLVGLGVWQTISRTGAKNCTAPGQAHTVELRSDAFVPAEIRLRQCDVLRVVNYDAQPYSLAFGVHAQHITYPGFSETDIRTNEFITIAAVQAGSFQLHDHIRDNAQLTLRIDPK